MWLSLCLLSVLLQQLQQPVSTTNSIVDNTCLDGWIRRRSKCYLLNPNDGILGGTYEQCAVSCAAVTVAEVSILRIETSEEEAFIRSLIDCPVWVDRDDHLLAVNGPAVDDRQVAAAEKYSMLLPIAQLNSNTAAIQYSMTTAGCICEHASSTASSITTTSTNNFRGSDSGNIISGISNNSSSNSIGNDHRRLDSGDNGWQVLISIIAFEVVMLLAAYLCYRKDVSDELRASANKSFQEMLQTGDSDTQKESAAAAAATTTTAAGGGTNTAVAAANGTTTGPDGTATSNTDAAANGIDIGTRRGSGGSAVESAAARRKASKLRKYRRHEFEKSKAATSEVIPELLVLEASLPHVFRTVPLLQKMNRLLQQHHRWLRIFCHYSASYPRLLRLLVLYTNATAVMLFCSVFYSVGNPDNGECDALSSRSDCLSARSDYTSATALTTATKKCFWDDNCRYLEPNMNPQIIFSVALLSMLLAAPVTVLTNWLSQYVLSAHRLPRNSSSNNNCSSSNNNKNNNNSSRSIRLLRRAFNTKSTLFSSSKSRVQVRSELYDSDCIDDNFDGKGIDDLEDGQPLRNNNNNNSGNNDNNSRSSGGVDAVAELRIKTKATSVHHSNNNNILDAELQRFARELHRFHGHLNSEKERKGFEVAWRLDSSGHIIDMNASKVPYMQRLIASHTLQQYITTLLVEERFDDKQIGRCVLFALQYDMLFLPVQQQLLLQYKHRSDDAQPQQVSAAAQYVAMAVLLPMNLLCLVLLTLFALQLGLERQSAWFKSCLTWLVMDFVWTSTADVVTAQLALPLMISSAVDDVKQLIIPQLKLFNQAVTAARNSIVNASFNDSNSNNNSSVGGKDITTLTTDGAANSSSSGDTEFNASSFLYSSTRLSDSYPLLRESKFVAYFTSASPTLFSSAAAKVSTKWSGILLRIVTTLVRTGPLLDVLITAASIAVGGTILLLHLYLWEVNPLWALLPAVAAVVLLHFALRAEFSSVQVQLLAKYGVDNTSSTATTTDSGASPQRSSNSDKNNSSNNSSNELRDRKASSRSDYQAQSVASNSSQQHSEDEISSFHAPSASIRDSGSVATTTAANTITITASTIAINANEEVAAPTTAATATVVAAANSTHIDTVEEEVYPIHATISMSSKSGRAALIKWRSSYEFARILLEQRIVAGNNGSNNNNNSAIEDSVDNLYSAPAAVACAAGVATAGVVSIGASAGAGIDSAAGGGDRGGGDLAVDAIVSDHGATS